MILSLILVPLVTSLFISVNDESSNKSNNVFNTDPFIIALVGTVFTFVLSLYLFVQFDNSHVGYQFVSQIYSTSFCSFHFGIDGLSLYFVLLTTFTMPISILASWTNVKFKAKYYLILLLVLETLLIAVFTVSDLILFYVFFESVLIPLFLIVGIWGGNNRIRASFLLFLYTLGGSLFMLLSILTINSNFGTTDFSYLRLHTINIESQYILWLGVFIGLYIKTPLIPFGHIWLPRAHGEAPVAGSIILAGLILKLATYGYVRVLIDLMPEATNYYQPMIQMLALVTVIYASFSCMRQQDSKSFIAMSSVQHQGIVILGLFSNNLIGIEGAMLLSVAHGFVSPGLFMIVGGVLYDRFHSRVLRYYRGLTLYMPLTSMLFFILTLANCGVPLSLNWLGEALSLMGIFGKSMVIGTLAASSIVLGAAYSIWLFSRMSFGTYSSYLTYMKDLNRREFHVLLPLITMTILLGIYPNVILDNLHVSVTGLLY